MTAVEQLLIELKADIKDMKKGLQEATKDIDKFKKDSDKSFISFKQVAETALGFGLANVAQVGLDAIKDFTIESIKSFAQVEEGMMSLQIQTGGTAKQLVEDLKVASNNTVNTMNLIASANKAIALGIDKEQLPELMKVAAARAKLMGITTTQAFQDISIGIGRQSKLILDNLGIILDLDKAYEQYADTLGKSASSLTDIEKRTAVLNSVLRESQATVLAMSFAGDSLNTRMAQLKQKFDEIKLSFGEFILGTESAEYQMKLFHDTIGLTTEDQDRIAELRDGILELDKQILNVNESLKATKNAMKELTGKKLEGESEAELKILEKRNELDSERQKLLEAQAQLKKGDFGTTNTNLDTGEVTTIGGPSREEVVNTIEAQRAKITELNDALDLLELQEKTRYDNYKERAQKKLEVETILKENTEQTFEEFNQSITDLGLAYDDAIKQTTELKAKKDEEYIQLLNLAKKVDDLALSWLDASKAKDQYYGTSSQGENAMIKNIVERQAVKNRETLSTLTTPSKTSTPQNVFNISIKEIYGIDASQISSALAQTLSTQVR